MVARRAHNPEVAGSSPVSATNGVLYASKDTIRELINQGVRMGKAQRHPSRIRDRGFEVHGHLMVL